MDRFEKVIESYKPHVIEGLRYRYAKGILMAKKEEDGLEHLQWAKDFMNYYEKKYKKKKSKEEEEYYGEE